MKRLLFITFILCMLSSTLAEQCVDKQKAVDCFFKRGDFDGDNALSNSDLEKVAQNYLPWYLRIAFNTFGGTKAILEDCDLNKDNLITPDEALKSYKCLDTCDKRNNVISYMNC